MERLLIKTIIREQTESIDSFINKIDERYSISEELKNVISSFIIKSGCENISFLSFPYRSAGISLHDKVIINNYVLFYGSIEYFLFVLFHEIAHQYQFNKYGINKMYEAYLGEIDEDEAANWVKKYEDVADEFATRKIRELQSKNLIDKKFVPQKGYINLNSQDIKNLYLSKTMKDVKGKNLSSPEEISEYFYNLIRQSI